MLPWSFVIKYSFFFFRCRPMCYLEHLSIYFFSMRTYVFISIWSCIYFMPHHTHKLSLTIIRVIRNNCTWHIIWGTFFKIITGTLETCTCTHTHTYAHGEQHPPISIVKLYGSIMINNNNWVANALSGKVSKNGIKLMCTRTNTHYIYIIPFSFRILSFQLFHKISYSWH